jgi:HlyD family secretion protein
MKKIIPPLIVLGVVAVLIVLIIREQNQRMAPDPPGQVSATGSIEVTDIDIAPEISGRIISMTQELGQKIDSGQLLALIDVEELKIRLEEIEAGFESIDAQIKSAQIKLENLNRNLKRTKTAYEAGAATKSQYDNLKTERDYVQQQIRTLETEKKHLEAQEQTLLTQISNSEVYSPVAGWITSKNLEEGELAIPGTPLYTLSILDRAYIHVYVNETRIGNIRLGDSAHVMIDTYPDRSFKGVVDFISPEAEFTPKNIQTKEERVKLVFEVRISLPNPEYRLKPGLPADVIIYVQE